MPGRGRGRLLRGASGVLFALGATALPLFSTGGSCPCCGSAPTAAPSAGIHPLLAALPLLLFGASAVLLRLGRPAHLAPPARPLPVPSNEPTR